MTRGGPAIETIYFNYVISELQQYDNLGKDFTDRQRIKRKVTRAVKKLTALPSLERKAIIHEINLIT